MRVTTVGLGVFMVIVSAGVTSPMAAQECEGRIYELVCGGNYYHKFEEPAPPASGYNDTYPFGYHEQCRQCEENEGGEWIPVDPEECHRPCFEGGGSEDQIAYETLIAAASSQNIYALLAVARDVPEKIRFNDVRRSLQITDCRDYVIANIPLGSAYTKVMMELERRRGTR